MSTHTWCTMKERHNTKSKVNTGSRKVAGSAGEKYWDRGEGHMVGLFQRNWFLKQFCTSYPWSESGWIMVVWEPWPSGLCLPTWTWWLQDLQLSLEQKSPYTQASTFTDTFPLELHHFHRVLWVLSRRNL